MIRKRFLVPVLALVAFGVTASADIVTYCNGGCGANNTVAFDTFVTDNALTYASLTDLTFTGTLSSDSTQYSYGDLVFGDSNMFTITGSNGLETDGVHDTITITVPATYSAIRLSLSEVAAGSGFFTCLDANCNTTANLSQSATTVDYVNTTSGSPWVITINSPFSSENIVVNSFNPAGIAATTTGPGDSETPEVGTLLLIGSGLIAMRWMRRVPRKILRIPQTA